MTEPRENKWTVVAQYPDNDDLKVGNFPTRGDAQASKQSALSDLDAEQTRIFPPGEVPDPDNPFGGDDPPTTTPGTVPEEEGDAVDSVEVPSEDAENPQIKAGKITTSPDVVPGNFEIGQDPLAVLPGWMTTEVNYSDRGDSSTTVNKRGCQVIAEYLNLEPEIEAVTRAEETDFEHATYHATITKPDGRTFSGSGTARATDADQGENAGWKLDMMAETRAYKRAVKNATGGGLEAFVKERGKQ
jgi:hypothetical protein